MPNTPERIYLQTVGERQAWTWADHEVDGSDTEYVRADLCAELEAYPPRSGHWTGVEMEQARYLISAMTGRTPEEVAELLSEFCHRLRYRSDELCSNCGRAHWLHTDSACDFAPGHVWSTDFPGMVVTDLDAWEGEDGG
jgi:hypothetical protein